MDTDLTPQEATELLRMLCPVGGMNPAEPEPVERARLCRRLYDHIKADNGLVPNWLKHDVSNIVGPAA
jgi:hypothetical protein